MDAHIASNWLEANQAYLSGELDRIRVLLERRVHAEDLQDPPVEGKNAKLSGVLSEAPPALIVLCSTFGLTAFERDVLLLCAGAELDTRFRALYAAFQNDPAKSYPTFSLALSVLPDAHWSAYSPARPLRYWRLIETGSGGIVTQAQMHMDERILHFLTGTSYLDERLTGYIRPVVREGDLPPSHDKLAQHMADLWSRHQEGPWPVIQLCGNEAGSKRDIAAHACAVAGLNLSVMPARSIPSNPIEAESLRRLWRRESVLSRSALLLDCDDMDTDPVLDAAIRRWVEDADDPLIVSSRERGFSGPRRVVSLDVHKPTSDEQMQLWEQALGVKARQLNGQAETLVSQFSLDSRSIHAIAAEVEQVQQTQSVELDRALWDACRHHAPPQLGDLAQHISPVACWEDLVLPQVQVEMLQDIVRQVRHRLKVYETWGFAGKSARGLGISALFAGVSGTGKTMAAEVLGNELGLELYRIDLSQVVSKYIGETEKNLRRVFDAAEESSAILLFDEADAIFGKRSEVRMSHDRYANIEVSYLLQRMEDYRGLAILTTNLKDAIDQAFMRRIRFVINFPFPDATQRTEIWKRVFPSQTPTEDLDVTRLAKLGVAGGNIHNIALYAAFLAADADEPVRMSHLLRAAQVEFAKLERPLTESEIGGWT